MTPSGQGAPLLETSQCFPLQQSSTVPGVPHVASDLSDLISYHRPPPASRPPAACFCVRAPYWPSLLLEHSWPQQPHDLLFLFPILGYRVPLLTLWQMAAASTTLPASAFFSCIRQCW